MNNPERNAFTLYALHSVHKGWKVFFSKYNDAVFLRVHCGNDVCRVGDITFPECNTRVMHVIFYLSHHSRSQTYKRGRVIRHSRKHHHHFHIYRFNGRIRWGGGLSEPPTCELCIMGASTPPHPSFPLWTRGIMRCHSFTPLATSTTASWDR